MGGAPGTTIDGRTYLRPGARSRLNGDGLATAAAAPDGTVIVLGVFERGEPKVPYLCATPQAISKKFPDLGYQIGQFLYEPAQDRKVRGRPSRVYLCRVNPATRASATLVDAGAANVLKILADDYGVHGNQTSYKAENGTVTGSQKWTFVRGSTTDIIDNVLLSVFSLTNTDTTELAALRLIIDPTATTGSVRVTFTSVAFPLSTDPITISPTKLAFDGPVTFTLDQVSGAATTITVTGVSRSTGSPVTEVLTIGAAATEITSETPWSDITSVVVATKGSATTLTLSGYAFDLSVAAYPTVASVKAKVDAYSGRGYTMALLTGQSVLVTDMDKIASPGTACSGASTVATATANLYETVRRINNETALVAAEKVAGGQLRPANVATAYLGGGSEGTTTASDWQAALDAIRTTRTDAVVVLSDDAAIHAKASAHARYMEGDGRDERMVFTGAAADESLDALRTRVIALNNRNVVLCGQEIQVYGKSGAAGWLAPMWQALQVAGLYCSLRNGVPLTEKIMNVIDVRNATSWDADEDAETVIERGVFAYYRSQEGFIRVLRQVTTYQQDTHEVFSLVSVNGSANKSIKKVREIVQVYIGDPDVDVDAAFLERKTIEELERQIDEKEITAFDADSVAYEPIGNGFSGAYGFAPVGAVEFVNIEGNLIRASDVRAAG